MLKINKKVEYAMIVLKYMANKSSPQSLISAREICDEFHTPFDTTAKVMQIMNHHELLKSVKGIKGGYYLHAQLEKVTYLDLVRMIEGKNDLGRVCTTDKGTCELFGKCNIATPIETLNKKLNSFLETLTLKELLQGHFYNHDHDNINNQAFIKASVISSPVGATL